MTQKNAAKLAAYPKQDIIDAIGRLYQADYITSQLVNDLEEKVRERLFCEHDEAFKKMIDARIAFLRWNKEMAESYGDGKTVRLVDVPPAEVTRGAALEKALHEAIRKEQRLDRKIKIILKEESPP